MKNLGRITSGTDLRTIGPWLNSLAAEVEKLSNLSGVGCAVKRNAGGYSIEIPRGTKRSEKDASTLPTWTVRVSAYGAYETAKYTLFVKLTGRDVVEHDFPLKTWKETSSGGAGDEAHIHGPPAQDNWLAQSFSHFWDTDETYWPINPIASAAEFCTGGGAGLPVDWDWCLTDGTTPPPPDSSSSWAYRNISSAYYLSPPHPQVLYFGLPFTAYGNHWADRINAAKTCWAIDMDNGASNRITGIPLAYFEWSGATVQDGLIVEQLQFGPCHIPALAYT